ncbi:MAG: replicative DNA helicase [Gammaproteobacteria bacterium]|nr:MAG: replicative DNA helicase [Pseudomonadota bacterium]MBC6945243.1 replicative DNA helicase [Gammaproteobacteria bacterium]MCE7901112.1 replicative DNA helicase [Gammaproteobacteria bacterium PRO9]MDL1880102.1 replicative DNA helicase [Gammaproteobacteria bacterium PRO2]MCL4776277.1 replicative DNA helicase [Gammaproteobacteria bacterium]
MASAFSAAEPSVAGIDRLNLPPSSVQAEQALLGGLMLDNAAWDRVADLVSEADFYRPDHRLIFGAIRALAERRQPFDAITISEYLESRAEIADAGGLGYLATLVRDTPSAANVADYGRIIRDRALLRELVQTGNSIVGSAFHTEGRPAAELVDEAEQRILEIARRGQRGGAGFVHLRDVLGKTIDRLDELHQAGGAITGVSTGFSRFDELTSGLQKGDLIIVAGRPSMGKTTLALNIAENAAFGSRLPVAVFSMEMSVDQLAFRMISSLGRVDQAHLRNGRFGDEEWPRIHGAVRQMADARIFIDDTPALTPTEVRSRARRLQKEHGLELIVLDYLQLMRVAGNAENRATEISEISRSLKALARELKVPVIALSQLNRSVEQRQDKKPVMSDLRESGAIEQDADLIVFIYREEVYNQNTPRKGIADITIAKQRNGPTGEFPLTFLGRYTRFENYAPEIEVFS